MRGVRDRLVGNDASVAEMMRLRRWRLLGREFPDLRDMRVVDLGGTASFWSRAPVQPRDVTIVNLFEADDTPGDIRVVRGDALEADALLRGERYDLAVSNSL